MKAQVYGARPFVKKFGDADIVFAAEVRAEIQQWEDMVYGLLQEWNTTFNHDYDITAFVRWKKANKMLPKHKRVTPLKMREKHER